jgi:hypothetical protein
MDNDMWFSSYDSSDDEILEELHDKFMVIYTMRYIWCTNTWEFSNPNKLNGGGQGVR